jgi:hypothetical protein
MPNDNNENENACHMQTTTTTTHCFRHGLWFAQVAFSVMALCAVTSRFMDDVDIQDQEKHVKWTVSALSVVLSLSSLSTIAHVVSQDVFVGSVMEGGMVRKSVSGFAFFCDFSVSLLKGMPISAAICLLTNVFLSTFYSLSLRQACGPP